MVSSLIIARMFLLAYPSSGFDNQGFAQTQAMDPFIRQFGDYNPTTKTYAIPSWLLSLLNSEYLPGGRVRCIADPPKVWYSSASPSVSPSAPSSPQGTAEE
jgi:hypothetical protein